MPFHSTPGVDYGYLKDVSTNYTVSYGKQDWDIIPVSMSEDVKEARDERASLDPERINLSAALTFRTGYNVCLLNFVDKLSQWSSFVSPDMKNFWEGSFGFNKEDLAWLEKYRTTRKKLGWGEAANLFGWAFHNFPHSEDYLNLFKAIKYFEVRKNKDDKSLREEVEEASQIIKAEEQRIKTALDILPIEEMLGKAEKLFGREDAYSKSIFCYLLYSPSKNLQGGANGEAVTIEVPLQEMGDQEREVRVIVHEFMHLVLRAGRVLPGLLGEDGKKFYSQKIPQLWADNLSAFFEEVIVYTLVDINLAGRDPQKMIDFYNDLKTKGADFYSLHSQPIWQATLLFRPILDDYLAGKVNEQETREKLFWTSKTFVSQFDTLS